MALKFQLLLLLILGVVFVQSARLWPGLKDIAAKHQKKRSYYPVTTPPSYIPPERRCDWPVGVCTYIYDSCPPDIPVDCRETRDCPLSTNKCCCRPGYGRR